MKHGSSRQQKKEQIIRLIKDAASPPPEINRRLSILGTTLIVLVIGTMLPSPAISTVCSIAAMLVGIHLWRFARKSSAHLSRKFKLALAALACTSILSGCSPAFFNGDHQDILAFLRDNGPAKEGQAWGVKVLGIEAKPASAEIAQAKGGVEEVQALEIREGFGLISVAMVKVYGE